MQAVIKTGGHQYRVKQGDEIVVDFMPGKNEGDVVTFDNVLMLSGDKVVVGSPSVEGAAVEATIVKQGFLPKVTVFKRKRRKNYKRTRGHKQAVTTVEIKKINH